MSLPSVYPCLIFFLPDEISTIVTQYRDNAYYKNLFDSDGNLKIFVPISVKYTSVFEGTDTNYIYGTQLVDGKRGSFISIGTKAYGFELEIKDGRDAIYNILRALVNNAYADLKKPKDIIVHDFVETEGNPDGITRFGKLTGLKQKTGIRRYTRNGNVRTISTGSRFQFMERDRRFVGQ